MTANTDLAGLPAGIYERISDDDEGTELGVTRQREDNDALARRLGLVVVDHYRDNDRSASTLARKSRPEYDRLVEDVRSGRVRVVVAYSNSRLTRQPRQLEDWIKLHDETGVQIVTVVSGQDDLSTADGRMVARIKANVDAAEAERTSERVKRQKVQRLAAGKPPASRWRTFGFTRDWQVIDSEAAIVREVFERVASGESLNSVTNDLRERDVRRVSGALWTYQATLRMVGSPIYKGRLSDKGRDAGAADVPVLVEPETFDLADSRREKRPGRSNVRKHLLSGTATCSLCLTGMTVTGTANGKRGRYVCNRLAGGCGKVSIGREAIDRLVENAVKTGLLIQGANEHAEPDTSVADAISEQIEALDGRIAQTQAATNSGALAFEDGVAMLADLRKQRAALVKTQTAAVEQTREFLGDLREFETADIGRRVAEVRRSISGIVVRPVGVRGSHTFDPSRLDVVLTNGERVNGQVLADHSMKFRDLAA